MVLRWAGREPGPGRRDRWARAAVCWGPRERPSRAGCWAHCVLRLVATARSRWRLRQPRRPAARSPRAAAWRRWTGFAMRSTSGRSSEGRHDPMGSGVPIDAQSAWGSPSRRLPPPRLDRSSSTRIRTQDARIRSPPVRRPQGHPGALHVGFPRGCHPPGPSRGAEGDSRGCQRGWQAWVRPPGEPHVRRETEPAPDGQHHDAPHQQPPHVPAPSSNRPCPRSR